MEAPVDGLLTRTHKAAKPRKRAAKPEELSQLSLSQAPRGFGVP